MSTPQRFVFGPFELDLRDERLWCATEPIHLNPKAFAVLRCLISQAGQLVTKDDLFATIWPDTVVSEAVLATGIRELRRALNDRARTPQYIETVYGRGYRFIASVSINPLPVSSLTNDTSLSNPMTSSSLFVGRQPELECLTRWFESTQQGVRRVGFIAGESGIGKTALVDIFVRRLAAEHDLWLGQGQCIDHYGSGEAYLPVLEALGRLGRGRDGDRFVSILRRYAPSWLAHLPSLSLPDDCAALDQPAAGVSPERMMRELAEAIEVLTETRPLVVVLEDLHWSDHATLDWLNYISRRRDATRLLILGTYRPVDAIIEDHPIRMVSTELRKHPQCAELVLDYLPEAAVSEYAMQRFEVESLPVDLARMLHQRTSGNPLFLTTVVDDLMSQGLGSEDLTSWPVKGGVDPSSQPVPSSVRVLIERDVDRLLTGDQVLLEAASVAGHSFSVSAVAAGVEQSADAIETRCAAWARQGRFIRGNDTETWPDGTVSACYQFIHALYHDVIYRRVSGGHKVRLHHQIGTRIEQGYGTQAREIAAKLGMHFERGQDVLKAQQYRHEAARNALNRSAYHEAIGHLSQGLKWLAQPLDNSVEARPQQVFSMLVTRSRLLMLTRGLRAPEVEQDLKQALILAQQWGDIQALSAVTETLWLATLLRAELQDAQTLAQDSLRLAQQEQDPIMVSRANETMGETAFYWGQFGKARDALLQCLAGYDVSQHTLASYWHESASRGVLGRVLLSNALWMLGYPDQSLMQRQEARRLAHQLNHPMSQASLSPMIDVFQGNVAEIGKQANELKIIAKEHGFNSRAAQAQFLQGWVLAHHHHYESGIALMWEGLRASQSTGMTLGDPWALGLIAEAYDHAGDTQRGLDLIEEALSLTSISDERWNEAELYRLKGELLLQAADAINGGDSAPEVCLQKAAEIARRQEAKSLELRATTTLARLWQAEGKRQDAYDLLARVYEWFTEGFDTADLQEAKALLSELER